MSTTFATTPEQRAAEKARAAEADARAAREVEDALATLDKKLAADNRLFLAHIAWWDPDSTTHGSTVQHDHDVANHGDRTERLLGTCTNRLRRAGAR